MYIDGVEQHDLKQHTADCLSLADAVALLPTCTDIVAVTSGATSVMTTTGQYRCIQTRPPRQPGKRGLRLYLHDRNLTGASYSPADHSACQPPSLTFSSAYSEMTHRTYLTREADDAKALSLAKKNLPHHKSQSAGRDNGNAPLLFSKAINRQVIPHFLVYLAELRLPVTLVSGDRSFTHSDEGPIDDISERGDLIYVRSGETTLSFDMTRIGRWRTRNLCRLSRPDLILEACDANGGAAFHFAATHRSCGHPQEAWRKVLTSLPGEGGRRFSV